VVEAALAHGADVRSTNRYGGTALIPAAEHAHVEVNRVLIAAGTPIDHVNELGWTALGEAVGLGNGDARHVQAVRLLRAAGADPSARDRFGRSVLQNAERLGQAEVARLIRAELARQ
jgi:ankyrin repeat protein